MTHSDRPGDVPKLVEIGDTTLTNMSKTTL